MPLLTRYLLWEFAKVFLVSLAGMTLMMMLVGVLREAMSQGLGMAQIMLLVPYMLPDALRFAVPGTILFATTSVFGRLSSSNEIVAIKALGISPMVLVWPMFILAFLLSLATVWDNDLAVSWGSRGIQRVLIESAEEIAYSMLRTRRSYSTKQFSINVKSVEGRKLILPTLTFNATDDSPQVTITAAEAELRGDPEHNTLSILMTNGTIDVGGHFSAAFPDTIERVVPLSEASRKSDSASGPSHRPMFAIGPEIVKLEQNIARQEQQLAVQAAFEMAIGDLGALAGDQWRQAKERLTDERYRLYRLQAEPHRRWANGFSCLCFVVVGVPMAVRRKNSDFLMSFFACFLPILLCYYPLLAYSVDRAKSGALPPYSVWLGNLILLLWGAHLLRKVRRY